MRVVHAQTRKARRDPLRLSIRIDTRSQGVPQLEGDQQEDRQKLISKLVRTVLSDPDKDNLSQELQESCHKEFTPVSEKARRKFIHKGTLKALNCAHCRKDHNASIFCALRHLKVVLSGVVHFFSRENMQAQKR